jgi:hypothetical protein
MMPSFGINKAMKTIPLNSAIFLVDVTPEQVSERFEPHEFVTADQIQTELVGPGSARPDLKGVVQSELERKMFAKLSLGERVVVDHPEMRRDTRIALAREAVNRGFSVFYMVDDLNIRRDLAKGDRLAEVVDLDKMACNIVKMLPDAGFFQELRNRGFAGITVVPDVHGNMSALRNAIAWAKSRNHFILFLGDVLDYGIDTLEVVEMVYQLVIRGEAELIMGNHEKKIYRYLSQKEKASHIRLSEGNRVTINRVNALSKFDHDRWVSRFKALVGLMRNHRTSEGFIFTHGAVRPEMFAMNDKRLSGDLESICLFGETDDRVKREDGFPNRVYNWVNDLVTDQVAIVGHDIRSEFQPLTVSGTNGGQAIFMDTGCGKGGHLSTVDLRFTANQVRIENFNIH